MGWLHQGAMGAAWARLFLGSLSLACLLWTFPLAAAPVVPPRVLVLTVAGPINPVVAFYIHRGLAKAETERCQAVVLQLDTPGGLDTAMREIIKDMIAAPMPVVVYVSPAGGRAASAGMYIAMASHVAAMAPDTAIGAAHPVSGEGEEIKGPMGDKVTNDAAAYARGLATQRGRNALWAEQAVRKSVSVSATEALNLHVVELIAPSVPALLERLDGRRVKVVGQEVVLRTRNAAVVELPMSAIERFLYAIANPAIALILLNLGVLALAIELQNPGAVLPGVVGVIALLLALFSLGMLPISGAGLALVFFGLLLFALELFVPSYGILTAGGVAAFVLGCLLLFGGPSGGLGPSLPFILSLSLGTGGLVALGMTFALRAQRRRVQAGAETLIGRLAVVRGELSPIGTVFLDGELWRARTTGESTVPAGAHVLVESREGLTLIVRLKPEAIRGT